MDFALITNLLLFLGAMGVTFALDGGGRSSDDEDEDRDAGEAASHRSSFLLHDDDPQTGEDSLAADRDNLAWFLNSGEVDFEALPSNDFAMLPPPAAAEQVQEVDATEENTEPVEDPAPPPEETLDPAAEDLAAYPATDPAAPLAEPVAPATTSIELAYLPAIDPETGAALVPELEVTPDETGGGSVVWLDGVEVARFDDLPDLSPDQISLLPETAAPDDESTADTDLATEDTKDPDDDHEDPDETPVLIDAFTPGADQIEIAYNPAVDAEGRPLPPEVTVEHSDDPEEQAALVLLDGQVVARVLGNGAAQLRPADIVTTAI